MTEIEAFPVETTRRFHFQWVMPILLKPRRTFSQILEHSSSSWLTPLLVLTVLALVTVFVAAPIRQNLAMNSPQNPPPDFQYWTPEQQAQYQQASTAASGPLFIYGLPILTAFLSVWIGWLLFAGILHLVLTLAGSRTGLTSVQNVVAWASMPFALRSIVQIVYMWATQRLIQSPGLSGFVQTEAGTWGNIAGAILALIDFYLIWQVILVGLGLRPLSGLNKTRIATSLLISLAILLILEGIPRFAGAQFGGMAITRPFFF